MNYEFNDIEITSIATGLIMSIKETTQNPETPRAGIVCRESCKTLVNILDVSRKNEKLFAGLCELIMASRYVFEHFPKEWDSLKKKGNFH